MTHYSNWHVEDVMTAWGKYKGLHNEGGEDTTSFAPYHIMKRDFYEIFCDFSIQSSTGGIAVLPLSDFDLFVTDEMCEGGGVNEILALEVFIMLMLCAKNSQGAKEKITKLFMMFDFNSNGSLNYDEVKIMIIMLNNALMKTLEETPHPKEDLDACADLLLQQIDSSHDSDISMDKFVSWASRAGVPMIEKFVEGKAKETLQASETVEKNRNQARLDPSTSQVVKRRAIHRYGLGAAQVRRKLRMDAYVARGREAGHKGKMNKAVMREAKQKELGRLHAVASQMCLTEMLITTSFEFAELSDLRLQFVDACGAEQNNQRRTLSTAMMKAILLGKYPRLEDGAMLTRLMHVFDVGGKGRIDFMQFVHGMNMLVKGGVEDKVTFILSAHDRDGDGNLQAEEFMQMMKVLQKMLICYAC
jgi:Ca2+-binding EF-hand superfamily protein